jgi:radical SAM protein with 4Fe4S-binding SPASM domain
MCGITKRGLTCDWNGQLYRCHRAREIGPDLSIGNIQKGVSNKKNRLYRRKIEHECFKSPSAQQYSLVSFCPVSVYQQHGTFSGCWNSMFCEMIDIKAKIVAKYHYALQEHMKAKRHKKQIIKRNTLE